MQIARQEITEEFASANLDILVTHMELHVRRYPLLLILDARKIENAQVNKHVLIGSVLILAKQFNHVRITLNVRSTAHYRLEL